MNFKSSILASVLLAVAGAASATTTPLALVDDGFGSLVASFSGASSGDKFTFVANAGDSLDVLSATSNYLDGVAGSGFHITGLKFDSISVGVNTPTPANFDNWSYSLANLSAGLHTIEVLGLATSGATFNGTVSITASVPEPESYALMMAGLGALAFVARRRKAA